MTDHRLNLTLFEIPSLLSPQIEALDSPRAPSLSSQGIVPNQKRQKNKFSELGLPGEEIVGAPLETLLTLSRGPQRPYMAKSEKLGN